MTRGVAPRNHAFPRPTLSRPHRHRAVDRPGGRREAGEDGVAVITTPDNRWETGRHQDRRPPAQRDWLSRRRGRRVPSKPGSSTRRFRYRRRLDQCLDPHQGRHPGHPPGRPGDPPRDHPYRRARIGREEGIPVEERRFTLAEALSAREAFITAASTIVMPVVSSMENRSGTASRGRWRPD